MTIFEIEQSTEPKKTEMLKILQGCSLFQNTAKAEELARDYIRQGVFSAQNREDARHIAYSVFYGVDIVASYNFKHIVKLSAIKKLQVANLTLGFHTPEIRSPEEIDI